MTSAPLYCNALVWIKEEVELGESCKGDKDETCDYGWEWCCGNCGPSVQCICRGVNFVVTIPSIEKILTWWWRQCTGRVRSAQRRGAD